MVSGSIQSPCSTIRRARASSLVTLSALLPLAKLASGSRSAFEISLSAEILEILDSRDGISDRILDSALRLRRRRRAAMQMYAATALAKTHPVSAAQRSEPAMRA
jgi:hypothetical protein